MWLWAYYWHSSSLRSLNALPSSTLTSILVRKVRVEQGTLRYRQNDESKCVHISNDYENYFNATVLEKVNTERRSPEVYSVEEEFYPVLYRLLTARRNWGSTFQFRCRSTFMPIGSCTMLFTSSWPGWLGQLLSRSTSGSLLRTGFRPRSTMGFQPSSGLPPWPGGRPMSPCVLNKADFDRVFLRGDSSSGLLVHEVASQAGKMDLSPLNLAGSIPIHPGVCRGHKEPVRVRNASNTLLNLRHGGQILKPSISNWEHQRPPNNMSNGACRPASKWAPPTSNPLLCG
ncbi:hypothetical protein Cgig2_000150 [Carnegiea gigantea]|uniref:Uncharacterized protein n=1 Tax=Carnegiea gigantea TaxID=171969 RepID=A0A9Q1GGM6_9CARY|nr:hypothetical protein Cgig2_000150 [Carnegiea gigantea]